MDDLAYYGLEILAGDSLPVGGLDLGTVLVEEVTDLTEPLGTFTCFLLLLSYAFLSVTAFLSEALLVALASVS